MFPMIYSETGFIFSITNAEIFDGFYLVLIWTGNIPPKTLKLFFLQSLQNIYADYFCCLMSMQHTSNCNEGGENELWHGLLRSMYLRYIVKSQLTHLPIYLLGLGIKQEL